MKHMKIAILGLILSLSTAAAVATEKPKHNSHSSHPTTTTVAPSATASQGQGQEQKQAQLQGQGQNQGQVAKGGNSDQDQAQTQIANGGSATQGQSLANAVETDVEAEASATNAGNMQTTVFEQKRQPVNTAVAIAGQNTLQCVKTGAAGVQFIGVGASVSLPKKDKDCALENAADRAYARGNKSAGDKLTCMTSYMRELYPDPVLCVSAQNELVAVPRPDGTGTDYVNPQQEREARIAAHPVGGK